MKVSIVAFAILLGTTAVAAADPIFPGASAVGLEPPAGMEPAKGFQGFKDAQASILITELPKAAFAQIDAQKAMFAQRFGAKNADDIAVNGIHGFVVQGRQTIGGTAFRKWIAVLDGPKGTALVTVQAPDTDTSLSDAAVNKALHTIAFREPPTLEQQVAALPFTVGDLDGFRTSGAMMGTAMLLTDGPRDTDPTHSQAHVVVSDDVGRVAPKDNRVEFAKAQLQAFQAIRTTNVTSAKPFDADAASWVEVDAEGSEGPNEVPVAITYFVRFGEGGTISVVCVAPKADAGKYAPRFKALAVSVRPKA